VGKLQLNSSVADPEPDPNPDPLVRGTNPRIRIRSRTKMSRICNTAKKMFGSKGSISVDEEIKVGKSLRQQITIPIMSEMSCVAASSWRSS
jgi:hypothetical protein